MSINLISSRRLMRRYSQHLEVRNKFVGLGCNFISGLVGYMHMHGLEFNANFKMISDWETAERQAFVMNFDMLLLGCLFHLGKKLLANSSGSSCL